MTRKLSTLALALMLMLPLPLIALEPQGKPTLFLIGDSTVKNGTKGQAGWGTHISALFDRSRIEVRNRALGGRSSRSYLREGLWDQVLAEMKPGDFVIMQFGHNDNGPLDSGKARASLKGNGDEAQDVTLEDSGAQETVRSYGWYLRRYIADAKAKGAVLIVCSLVPRNIWKDGRLVRSGEGHARWARDAAAQEGAWFIDLNEIVAGIYEATGQPKVATEYFTAADHTHTTAAGARVNALAVAEAIRALDGCWLREYLLPARTLP
jgi:lysophospholipase L1-like esterase